MASEDLVKQELEELQKQLGKKQKFEDAVSSLKSLLQTTYPSASTSLRKSVCSFRFNFYVHIQFCVISCWFEFFNLIFKILGFVHFSMFI